MDPLDHSTLRGTWATLLLPIQRDQRIDFTALEEEISILIGMQVDGIYSNGTAGEFYAQTEAEFDKVHSLFAEKCNAARMPFQIGCSHMSAQISLERIRRCIALKPSAIQIILPDWAPPSMSETIEFLSVMEEAANPVRLVLYNPPHAKVTLRPEDFRQIREAGVKLIGCKVAGGDGAWYEAMKTSNADLSLFVPGHALATGISSGAHGSYSNVACLHPRIAARWYRLMCVDMPRALQVEKRIQGFIGAYILPYINKDGFSNTAIDKFLAAIGGWGPVGTRVRWPYRSLSDEAVIETRKICRDVLPEFFNESISF